MWKVLTSATSLADIKIIRDKIIESIACDVITFTGTEEWRIIVFADTENRAT